MASGTRASRPAGVARRTRGATAGARRPAMSEMQLAAYLAARDAVRRARRFSLLLPFGLRR
ncbi:MAG: hypothetical protein EOO27_07490 [Comamonadaceae bacterium]|nr:MAG: hypothetical protein EOO27_07490 [Comamonadaceae bacterium]